MATQSTAYYGFFLNMWIMGRVTEAQLQIAVDKGYLTAEERDMIIATPQA